MSEKAPSLAEQVQQLREDLDVAPGVAEACLLEELSRSRPEYFSLKRPGGLVGQVLSAITVESRANTARLIDLEREVERLRSRLIEDGMWLRRVALEMSCLAEDEPDLHELRKTSRRLGEYLVSDARIGAGDEVGAFVREESSKRTNLQRELAATRRRVVELEARLRGEE